MVARAFAFCLLVAAALANNSGARSSAFYFLLAAVPAIGVGGLVALGELVDIHDLPGRIFGAIRALSSFVALALAFVVAGSSSGSLFEAPVPGLGFSAFGACLGVFVFQAGLGLLERALRHPPALYVRAGEDFVTAEHIGL